MAISLPYSKSSEGLKVLGALEDRGALENIGALKNRGDLKAIKAGSNSKRIELLSTIKFLLAEATLIVNKKIIKFSPYLGLIILRILYYYNFLVYLSIILL